jgi:hypothetical protein
VILFDEQLPFLPIVEFVSIFKMVANAGCLGVGRGESSLLINESTSGIVGRSAGFS